MKNRKTEKRLLMEAKTIADIMKEQELKKKQEAQKLLKKNDETFLADILEELAECLYQSGDLSMKAAELILSDHESDNADVKNKKDDKDDEDEPFTDWFAPCCIVEVFE